MARPLELHTGEIELFRAGDYPQGKWPLERVQAIADSYDPKNEHQAYVKASHKDGGMAYGLFESLRMAGESLIGKLAAATPQAVKDAFATGQVSGWSSEIYEDYQGTGKPYLKALALLGAVPPAIKGLKHALDFHEDADRGPVAVFDMPGTPYAARSLVDVLESDEMRRELYDLTYAFQCEFDRVTRADELSLDQKRAELNRLASELATLTAAEVTAPEAGAPGETSYSEGGKTVSDPKTPAAPVTVDAGPTAAQFAELQGQMAKLTAAVTAKDEQIESLGRGIVRGKIAGFSEAALKDGKLTVGDKAAGIDAFMEAIEPVFFEVTKDGKTEKVSALSFFQDHVTKRVTAVPKGVKSTKADASEATAEFSADTDLSSAEFAEQVQAYADEHKMSFPAAYKKCVVLVQKIKSA